jgi:hypothetical protein
MEALKASLATSRRPGARKAAARKEEPPAKADKAADARSRPAKKAARG